MSTKRELYRQRFEAQIVELESQISALKATTEKMAAQTREEMKPTIEAIRSKYDASKVRLHDLTAATEEGFEEGATALDRGWLELKAMVQGGFDAVKKHKTA